MFKKILVSMMSLVICLNASAAAPGASAQKRGPIEFRFNSYSQLGQLISESTNQPEFLAEYKKLAASEGADLNSPPPGITYLNGRLKIEGVTEPFIVDPFKNTISYKNTLFSYEANKSLFKNVEKMKEVWGQFSELGFGRKSKASLFFPEARAMFWIAGIVVALLTFCLMAVTAVSSAVVVGNDIREYSEKRELEKARPPVKFGPPMQLKCNAKDTENASISEKALGTTGALFSNGQKSIWIGMKQKNKTGAACFHVRDLDLEFDSKLSGCMVANSKVAGGSQVDLDVVRDNVPEPEQRALSQTLNKIREVCNSGKVAEFNKEMASTWAAASEALKKGQIILPQYDQMPLPASGSGTKSTAPAVK